MPLIGTAKLPSIGGEPVYTSQSQSKGVSDFFAVNYQT